jgi:hypothetical protein
MREYAMITHEEARQKVRLILDSFEEEDRNTKELRKDLTPAERVILGMGSQEEEALQLVIIDDHTIEAEFGWVFFWSSQLYERTGKTEHALAGNAPFLVSKQDGAVHETGTANPIDYYIGNYIRCGDPNG